MIPVSMAEKPHPLTQGSISMVEAVSLSNGRLEIGRVRRMKLRQNPEVSYYLYLPSQLKQPARFFVTVHGISRNAREHAKRFASYAEQAGVILIAPIFKRKGFPGYQRLAPNDSGQRPDIILDQIVDEVRQLTSLPPSKLYLFGFSGGGQFVHRYLMQHPKSVASAVIGAAGWYTFPDPARAYPRGLGLGDDPTLLITDRRFLQIPVNVVVGDQDTERDSALNRSRHIDRQQGHNRVERGQHWIEAMRTASRSLGYATKYRFILMPDIDHDFTDAMVNGAMGDIVFAHLFGATQPNR